MLRAIIFDFNGVILNDEPLHFRAMQQAVAEIGIQITKQQYWERYLPFDDETCLDAVCQDAGVRLDEPKRTETLERKSRLYRGWIKNEFPLFPDASEFIRKASELCPLAIASGARREEVLDTLDGTGLSPFFRLIVAAEDFAYPKPHPESFLLALERLNAILVGDYPPVLPRECLVIEDSVGGVRGARAAGMACLAVANSYPVEKLREADLVVGSLGSVKLKDLQQLCEEPS